MSFEDFAASPFFERELEAARHRGVEWKKVAEEREKRKSAEQLPTGRLCRSCHLPLKQGPNSPHIHACFPNVPGKYIYCPAKVLSLHKAQGMVKEMTWVEFQQADFYEAEKARWIAEKRKRTYCPKTHHPKQSLIKAATRTHYARNWYSNFHVPPYFLSTSNPGGSIGEEAARTTPGSTERPVLQQQQNGNVQQAGREFTIPSPLQRFLAEMLDFFILFFIKATIILSIMHLSGMKDISKFAMHFIVEEIDEDTSMEELQKMMLVALVYRILVCFYEVICIWGAGGATPGKFIVGLRVVSCDTSVLVRPNRVLVVPATNVTLSASTVRALNKNFSIAFFFPAFITLLFFQHNRTVYDIVAGTIVVKRNRVR
ncbi:hypothetical protein GJAV_G00016900 [Gymnothorax javanicus]|nr:hypothetical protein GJAV_G00016900 [Gymnothorax javanicus]